MRYSPQGLKESDSTEVTEHTCMQKGANIGVAQRSKEELTIQVGEGLKGADEIQRLAHHLDSFLHVSELASPSPIPDKLSPHIRESDSQSSGSVAFFVKPDRKI